MLLFGWSTLILFVQVHQSLYQFFGDCTKRTNYNWYHRHFHIIIIIIIFIIIVVVVRLFANGPGDRGSVPGRVIPKTLKMVLDTSLLKTQHYKIRIKGKVEQARERSSALPYTFV